MPAIDKIPPEVLLKIFLFAVVTANYVDPPNLNAPWSVSQVCRYWRYLALNAPELWCFILVNAKGAVDVELMADWLERSVWRPIDVVLSVYPEGPVWDADNTEPCLESLAAHIKRWNSIKLAWGGDDLTTLANAVSAGNPDAPLLKSFHLTTSVADNGDAESFIEHQIFDILQQASNLESFFWKDQIITRGTLETWEPLIFPGKRLRELQLYCNISTEEIVAVLYQCPALQTFVVTVDIAFSEMCGPPAHLVHNQLNILTIAFGAEMRLFDFLTLPSLSELRVGNISPHSQIWQQELFTRFLGRSHCPLTILELSLRLDVSEADMINTLRTLPSLGYLRLHHYITDTKSNCVGATMLQLLCSVVDGDRESWSLCPNLQGFALIDVINAPVARTCLPKMIESRAKGFIRDTSRASYTEDMRIRVDKDYLHPEDLETLEQLQRDWPNVLRVSFGGEDGDDNDDEGDLRLDERTIIAEASLEILKGVNTRCQ